MADVIQEFLVAIGIKLDQSGLRRAQDAIKGVKGSVASGVNLNLGIKIDVAGLQKTQATVKGLKEEVGKGATFNLDFKVDDYGLHKVQTALKSIADAEPGLRKTSDTLKDIAKGTAAAGTAFVVGMNKIADQFQEGYLRTQRINVSGAEQRAVSTAATQVAGSDVVTPAMESLAALSREFQKGTLASMVQARTGASQRLENPKEMMDSLLKKMRENFLRGDEQSNVLLARAFHLNYEALRPAVVDPSYQEKLKKAKESQAAVLGPNPEETQRLIDLQGHLQKAAEVGLKGTAGSAEARAYGAVATPYTEGIEAADKAAQALGTSFNKLSGTMQDVILKAGGVATALGIGVGGLVGGLVSFGAQVLILRRLMPVGAAAGAAGSGAAGAAGAGAAAPGGWRLPTPGVGGVLRGIGTGLIGAIAEFAYESIPWVQHAHKKQEAFEKEHGTNLEWLKSLIFPSASATTGQGGGLDSARELSDWLHGSTSMVPTVRLADGLGLGRGGEGLGGAFMGGGGNPRRHGDPLGLGGPGGGGDNLGDTTPPGLPKMSGGKGSAEIAKQAVSYFMSQGWTREQAAGIAANLGIESSWQANAVGDRGAAYGLGQWHPDRQANFKKVFGHDIKQSTIAEQLAFVQWELTHTEAAAGKHLKAATSAAESGGAISQYYERPADRAGNMRLRGGAAEKLFGQTTGLTAGGPDSGAYGPPMPSADTFGPQPSGSVTNNSGHTVNVDNRTEINLASGEFSEHMRSLDSMLKRQNGDMVRHLQGAVR